MRFIKKKYYHYTEKTLTINDVKLSINPFFPSRTFRAISSKSRKEDGAILCLERAQRERRPFQQRWQGQNRPPIRLPLDQSPF